MIQAVLICGRIRIRNNQNVLYTPEELSTVARPSKLPSFWEMHKVQQNSCFLPHRQDDLKWPENRSRRQIMDFVTKKAVESKFRQLGDETGLNDVLGIGSSSNANNDFSLFSSPAPDEESGQRGSRASSDDDVFPAPVATYFDDRPNNFPPLISLCYIDHAILSDKASSGVRWAYRTFVTIELLLVLNVVSGILFTILNSQIRWIYMCIGIVIAAFITIFELFGYDTAFRGAYRTSSRIRQRYLVFCAVNVIICSLYTFIGAGWFNGWSRISVISEDNDVRHRTLRTVLTVAEAAGWTGLLFMCTFTFFEYYHLLQGKHQGLSNEALRHARSGIENGAAQSSPSQVGAVSSTTQQSYGGANGQSSRDRMEQIRNKYRTPPSNS